MLFVLYQPLNIFWILVFLVFWFYLHWWDISCRNGHLQNSNLLQFRYFCYFIQWSVSYCLFHQSAISIHCVSTTEVCSCKALYSLPFLKKKSFFPFIVFFFEKKEKIKFISPLIISFFLGIFVLKCKNKNKIKRRGGGRALQLQALVISTMYIYYRYPLPDIKGWQVRKRVF